MTMARLAVRRRGFPQVPRVAHRSQGRVRAGQVVSGRGQIRCRARAVASAHGQLLAIFRTSPSPACATIPVPSPVTSTPSGHAATFTSEVLLGLGPVRTLTPLLSQFRSAFYVKRAAPAPTRVNLLG